MSGVIEFDDLTCRYRRVEAVRGLSFSVPEGSIFGLLGPNGAGKTTTIRALMNIVRPLSGAARVFGVDSRRLGPDDLQTIGYVSENQALPHWMTVAELLRYCKPFYPTWDDGLAARLVRDIDLPTRTRIGRLSRGMRVKAALVSSLAYRPRLLVLDEPFSGLDPVVREDLVQGVLERAGEQGWTVLLSSHDLDEVEKLADAVALIDNGRLVLTEPLADMQARFRRVDVTADDTSADVAAQQSTWINPSRAGRVLRFTDTAYAGPSSDARYAAAFPGRAVAVQSMSLREIFVALVRKARAAEGARP